MATLREDAEAVWQAALAAVAPDRLVTRRWKIEGDQLFEDRVPLDPPVRFDRAKRIVVVGGGKAAAGLAAGLEELLPATLPVSGLIGVPAGCGLALPRLEVREVRPVGRNEPTEACVTATHEMLAMLADLTHDDIALAVVTGGGSAILTAPLPGIPLAEITACTRWLSEHGATIGELNQVRQAISSVKAGGLARRCGAGRLVVLVISDVIGDPLETISSGPCMPVAIDPAAALATLERFSLPKAGIAPSIVAHLQTSAVPASAHHAQATQAAPDGRWRTPSGCDVSHHMLASNATALQAAADQAAQLGYRIRLRPADPAVHETANDVGRRLAAEGLDALRSAGQQRLAILEGGEATVDLPAAHGIGGRNQQSVAAALDCLVPLEPWPAGLLLASIGTDGEDGPTDAAGGVATDAVAAAIADQRLSPADAVRRCDAFPLLRSSGGLVHTGPTGTNVADLRMVLVEGGIGRP
ncbi:MAG: DUF4147 domain-containing protein [Pirellulales bacterium]